VSEASANLIYACEQWEIDLGRRELRSRGIPVPLGGRAFEVITVLVQSASEFVTKDHLMERVWPAPPSARVRSTFTYPRSARRWVRILLRSRGIR
jgi:DNA-binding response OmpR family regulator